MDAVRYAMYQEREYTQPVSNIYKNEDTGVIEGKSDWLINEYENVSKNPNDPLYAKQEPEELDWEDL